MRKIIVYLLIFCLSLSYLSFADDMSDDPTQPCCNGFIKTDPTLDENGNPYANNPAKPGAKNHFNWMEENYNIYHEDLYDFYNNGTNQSKLFFSPFWEYDDYLSHLNSYRWDPNQFSPDSLNFWPKDGWELLYKNNGFMYDESTLISEPSKKIEGPLYIFYNKYTGKLRLLAAQSSISTNVDNVLTKIEFFIPNPNNNLYNYSSILSDQTNIAQPLDQYTKVTQVAAGSKAPSNGKFFAADFYVTYDPCNCHHRSMLDIDFFEIDSANIELSGRMIATSVQLEDDGNSPLLNGRRDFLSSVYTNGFDVYAGALTYDNIDSLVALYKKPDLSLFEGIGLDALKEALKGIGKAGDALLNTVVGTQYFDQLVSLGVYSPSDTTAKKMQKLGIGVLAYGADKLYAEIDSRKSIPEIYFIEGEMALAGNFYEKNQINGADIRIAVPGSKDSENETYTPLQYYPTYNEALGVFALLETPTVFVNNNERIEERGENEGYTEQIMKFKLDKSSIKYKFNPAADVNLEKTKISAALVFNELNPNHESNDNIQFWDMSNDISKVYNDNNIVRYITDFYPLGCIGGRMFNFNMYQYYNNSEGIIKNDFINLNPSDDIKLRLILDIVHNENIYGKVNRELKIMTYPVKFSYLENISDDLYNFPLDTTITTTIYAQNIKIVAQNDIIVNGTLSSQSNISAELIAGNSIKISNSHLKDNTEYRIGLHSACEEVSEVSNTYVKNFCTGSNYRAKDLAPIIKQKILAKKAQEMAEILITGNTIQVNPNPFSDITTITISLTNSSNITLAVFDMLGNKIHEFTNNEYTQAGRHRFTFDATNIPSGMYYVNLISQDAVLTEPLIIAK